MTNRADGTGQLPEAGSRYQERQRQTRGLNTFSFSALRFSRSFSARRLPLVALLATIVFLLSCENDPEIVNQTNERKPALEEAFKIQSYLSQNGNLRAQLVAPYMVRYNLDTSYLEFPKTLHVNFYDSAGHVESQVDARYGKYFETRSLVYLRDSVVVFNVKGDTLRTPDLWWDQNTRKFFTANRVRIHRKDQRLIGGKGMDATQDLSDITVFQIESPSYILVPDSMRVQ